MIVAPPMEDARNDATSPNDITQLLVRIRDGDTSAEAPLAERVYEELQRLARAVFSSQNRGHTLQPTALVHEAWVKLAGNLASINDRHHFFVVAGKAMRQVIANHARAKQADKRGGGGRQVTLDTDLTAAGSDRAIDLVDLDDCLERLAAHSERLARVAEMRLFSGLAIDEVAEVLDVSPRTVDGDWAMAKAWLGRALEERA